MATLRKHGHEVGRVALVPYVKAYMADGMILRNNGAGWKVAGKCKPGVTPEQAYATQVRALGEAPPGWQAYRNAIIKACPATAERAMLHYAITLMPGDPDGVWSEVTDTVGGPRLQMSVKEIAELCRLYRVGAGASDPRASSERADTRPNRGPRSS